MVSVNLTGRKASTRLGGIGSMKSGEEKSHTTPEPEGPEQIAEKVQRTRDGFSGRVWRAFWRMTGLENLSPGKRMIILLVGFAELGILGLGIFTDLSASWLITAALAIAPLVFHKTKKEKQDDGTASGKDSRWET
jgi:hypothetical protein